jgi:alkylhydroperoxidase/carboxymuconolactone decarboxylase family protein YurZ
LGSRPGGEPTRARKSFGHIAPALPFHVKRAVENGWTRDEIVETITHLAFYAGWPAAMTALQIARRVFAESGI